MLKLAVLSISSLIISFASVSGVFPSLQSELELSQLQSDLMMTIPALAVVIFIFLSNLIVKYLGIKNTVLIGMIVSGVGGVFPTFVQSFIPILISRFLLGAGVGLVNTWAVRYITLLFEPEVRAKMMGYRSSAEIIGQMIVALTASFLFNLRWELSFLAYSIAFVSAFLILIFVPSVELPKDADTNEEKVKMPFVIYLLAVFASMVVMLGATIAFRYPSLATVIRGLDYNPNFMMGIWPIFSIIAAITYGRLSALLGRKLIYVALTLLIIAAFLSGIFANNYLMIVTGLFLHGVVPAWIFPFVFMTAAKITTGKMQSTAFSYIAAGIKIGVFSIPFSARLFEIIFNSTSLSLPYLVFGSVLFCAMIYIALFGAKIVRKAYL